MMLEGWCHYTASGLVNRKMASLVNGYLENRGSRTTYDWTKHGSVEGSTKEEMGRIAKLEADGVIEADFLVVLMPGFRGTHAEIGAALGTNTKIFMWVDPSEDLEDILCAGSYPCIFHHHPLVSIIHGDMDELLNTVQEWATQEWHGQQ